MDGAVRQTDAPAEFEGIFPPAWKKGDTWRVEFLTWDRPGGQHTHRGSFRVATLASKDHDFHTLEFRHDDSEAPPTILRFRAADFSVATIQDSRGGQAYDAIPFVHERRVPMFAVPMLAPGRVNPFYFHLEHDEDQQTRDGWQLFLPRGAEALTIQLVSRSRYHADQTRVVMEWRRGDPWYSSARCYRSGGVDSILDNALSETLNCAASLVRTTDRPRATQTQ